MEQNKIESKNRDLLSGSKKPFDPHQPRCDWDYIPEDLLVEGNEYYGVHRSDCNQELLDLDAEPEPLIDWGFPGRMGFLRSFLTKNRLPIGWKRDPFFQFIPGNHYYKKIRGLVYPADLVTRMERWGCSTYWQYRICKWFCISVGIIAFLFWVALVLSGF